MTLPKNIIEKIMYYKDILENPPYNCEHKNVKKDICKKCLTKLCDKCKWKLCWCFYE